MTDKLIDQTAQDKLNFFGKPIDTEMEKEQKDQANKDREENEKKLIESIINEEDRLGEAIKKAMEKRQKKNMCVIL